MPGWNERRHVAFARATEAVAYVMSADWSKLLQLEGRGILADTHEPDETWIERHVHPDDRMAVTRAVAAALEAKGVFDLEHRAIRADGGIAWVRSRAVPVFDDHGALLEWVGAATDVTGRKQLESDLRDRELHLRLALEAAVAIVFQWDITTGKVKRLFSDVASLPSTSAEDGTFQDVLAAVHPEDRPNFQRAIDKALRTGDEPFQSVHRFVEPDGAVRWVVEHGRVEIDARGAPTRLLGVTSDITETRDAHNRLNEAYNRLQSIIDNTPAYVYALDLDRRFILANKQVARYLGATPRELQGRRRSEFMPESDAVQHEANDEKVIATGEPIQTEEQGDAAGGPMTWLTVKFPIRDGTGRITGIGGISSDITERKLAEEREQLLVREVHHRSRNMLSLVKAIAWQTAASGKGDFMTRLSDRIDALAAAQDLFLERDRKAVSLDNLVCAQLAPLADFLDTRVSVQGPMVELTPAAAQALGMALHELATNAVKHGALSNTVGAVAIDWRVDDDATFEMAWCERDGPPVRKPERQGFGSTVTCSLVARALDVEVETDFAPEGFSWRVRCPLRGVTELESGRGRDGDSRKSARLPLGPSTVADEPKK